MAGSQEITARSASSFYCLKRKIGLGFNSASNKI
jgi:hypothetical protein